MSRLDTRIPLQVPNTLAQGAQISAMSAADQGTRNALASQMRQDAIAPIQRNALAAQTQGSELQNMAAEQATLGRVLDQLQTAPQTWDRARGFLVENGIFEDGQLPEQLTPEVFEELRTIAYSPPEELTDWQRQTQGLGPDEVRQAQRIKLGLAPDANASLRGRTGDKPTTAMQEYEFARSQGFEGDFQQWKELGRSKGMELVSDGKGGFTLTQGGGVGGKKPKKLTEQMQSPVDADRQFQMEKMASRILDRIYELRFDTRFECRIPIPDEFIPNAPDVWRLRPLGMLNQLS